jgi:hypothetical protein
MQCLSQQHGSRQRNYANNHDPALLCESAFDLGQRIDQPVAPARRPLLTQREYGRPKPYETSHGGYNCQSNPNQIDHAILLLDTLSRRENSASVFILINGKKITHPDEGGIERHNHARSNDSPIELWIGCA